MLSKAKIGIVLFSALVVPTQFANAQEQPQYPLGKPPAVSELAKVADAPQRIEITPNVRSIAEATSVQPANPISIYSTNPLSGVSAVNLETETSQNLQSTMSLAEDCVLEVNKIESSEASSLLAPSFSLKLIVPDSVKVVEVVPRSHNNADRSIRLNLGGSGQTSMPSNSASRTATRPLPMQEIPAADTTVLNLSMMERTTETPASRQQLYPDSDAKERYYSVPGYKKNPFYSATASIDVPKLNLADDNSAVEQTNAEFSILSDPTPEAKRPIDSPTESTRHIAPAESFEVPIAISGPSELAKGEESEFEVEVYNKNKEELGNFTVELSVPKGLQLSVLDRPARVNVEQRTVTWDIETMLPSETQKIRYKVIATHAGSCSQLLTVSKDDTFSASCQLATQVTVETHASDSEAEMLPFESDEDGK